MHTDPIADMLTRVRNASRARHKKVDIPSSQMKLEIARVLLAVMFHIGAGSDRLTAAGGGNGLRSEAFRRLGEGETAREIFDG